MSKTMSLNLSFEIALIKDEVAHEVFYHRTIYLNMKRETIPIRQKPAIDDMSLESYSEGGFEDDFQPVAINIHEFFFLITTITTPNILLSTSKACPPLSIHP